MRQSVEVLLLDDGELDDVQAMLEEMKVPFGRVRGGAIVRDTPPPRSLLVSTPRRIDAVRSECAGGLDDQALVRIVVVSEDSPSLRARLRRIGFDYMVRRPVHPEALRLLLLHCLYQGEERRREPRIPVGFEVSFRTGILRRSATLVDLSSRGCRLLSSYALEPGRRLTVQLPEALGAAERLSVRGRVVRMSFEEHPGDDGLYSAAILFEKLSSKIRQELEWILEARAKGPAVLHQEIDEGIAEEHDSDAIEEADADTPPEQDSAEATSTIADADAQLAKVAEEAVLASDRDEPPQSAEETGSASSDPADRRHDQRAAFGKKVPAFGSRALRVLVARDLSKGGMRIEPSGELELCDRLHLAIYGAADQEPFLVWATVARDDGNKGIGLVFDELDPAVAEKLDCVVMDLPAVESLHDDEARAMGTVVTEILDS